MYFWRRLYPAKNEWLSSRRRQRRPKRVWPVTQNALPFPPQKLGQRCDPRHILVATSYRLQIAPSGCNGIGLNLNVIFIMLLQCFTILNAIQWLPKANRPPSAAVPKTGRAAQPRCCIGIENRSAEAQGANAPHLVTHVGCSICVCVNNA